MEDYLEELLEKSMTENLNDELLEDEDLLDELVEV